MPKIYEGRVFGGPLHGRLMSQNAPSYCVVERPREKAFAFLDPGSPVQDTEIKRHTYTHTDIEGSGGRRVPIWIHYDLTLENLLAGLLSLEFDTEALAPLVDINGK